MASIKNGDIKKAKSLIAAGVEVDAQDIDGHTAVYYFAKYSGDEDLLNILKGKSVNLDMKNNTGQTLLMEGIKGKLLPEENIIKLIEAGANVNLHDDKYSTVAEYFIEYGGGNKLLTVLKDAGADFDIIKETDSFKKTF